MGASFQSGGSSRLRNQGSLKVGASGWVGEGGEKRTVGSEHIVQTPGIWRDSGTWTNEERARLLWLVGQ